MMSSRRKKKFLTTLKIDRDLLLAGYVPFTCTSGSELSEQNHSSEMLGIFSQLTTAKPLLISSSLSSSSLSSCSRNGTSFNSSPQSFPLASRIFVRNLSYSTSEASLIKLFSRFGHIIDVQHPRNEESKHSKGYAFIQYCSQEEAILAVEEMDHKRINGRIVYAEIARPLHGGCIGYPKTSGPPSQKGSVAK